mgnify:CR=1 FL=1
MKEKDKWIKNFRTRMEGYSEPAPADLWEQLEKELDTVPKVIPMWRRWQAAAAVALLVVVSSLTVWFWQSPSANYLEQQSAGLNVMHEPDELVPGSITPEQPMALVVPAARSEEKKHVKVVRSVTAKALAAEQEVLLNKEVEEIQIEENYIEEQKAESVIVEQKQQKQAGRSSYSAAKTNYAYVAPHRKKDRNWSIGLSTGNGTFSSSTSMDGYLPLPNGARNATMNSAYGVETRAEIDKLVQFNNLSEGQNAQSDIKYRQRQMCIRDRKYRMPVTFGASLRFDLSDDWAVETGVTYTQLSSETRSGTQKNNYGWEEKLHYVGIPLKVNRNIWSNKRFEVYASAGGAVEKCVSGKRSIIGSVSTSNAGKDEQFSGGEEDVKVKPLQWSLSAAAGAQFKITEKLGIYAEPGVVYYFDDGSNVNTIRKEHPFNFNIQLGVRFTLPK